MRAIGSEVQLECLLCGGLYWSSVQVHGSRAAPELVPIATLVMASPTVNCSSTCLALTNKIKKAILPLMSVCRDSTV